MQKTFNKNREKIEKEKKKVSFLNTYSKKGLKTPALHSGLYMTNFIISMKN